MTEQKRFVGGSYGFYDRFYDIRWLWSEWVEVIKIMNNLDLKARERSKALSKLQKENEQLKSENKELKDINQDHQDHISLLEEEKINLQIKLQKIRDYAMEDGEVKQGVIEKVVFE